MDLHKHGDIGERGDICTGSIDGEVLRSISLILQCTGGPQLHGGRVHTGFQDGSTSTPVRDLQRNQQN